jgi:hypothetical protein
MPTDRSRALAEFKRMILWIALAGVAMVGRRALVHLSYEPLRLHMVIATILGVFSRCCSAPACSPPPSSATRAATTRK